MRPSVKFNPAELDALKGLPLAARVLYVEGIRPFMDYATGVVGASNSPDKSISLQSLSEVLYVEPRQGRTGTGSRSRKHARVCIETLAEAGLISSHSIATQSNKRLILKCLLADTDESVQIKQGTNRARKQGTNRAQDEARDSNGLDDTETPYQGTPETPYQGTPPDPVSHIDTHISRARVKTKIPPDFDLDKTAEDYLAMTPVPKKFALSVLHEFRLANIASEHLALNWAAEFSKYCSQQWRFQQSFDGRNQKKGHGLRFVPNAAPPQGNKHHGFNDGG